MTDDAHSKRVRIEPVRRRLLGLRPVSLVSWRDAFATLTPIVLISAAAIFFTLHFVRPAPPMHLSIASGPPGSAFHMVAERYHKILERNGIDLQVVDSHGSADNLDLLATHKVDIALVQSGVTRQGGTDDIVSLGTMFRQPVLVFYRAPQPITRLSELAGKRIAVGSDGSGTHVLALTLLDGNGIEPGGKTTFLDLEGKAAADALIAHKIDAAFVSGDSAGLRIIGDLLHSDGVRLFDFVQGEAYERRYRYLNRFELPPGAFDLGANLPDHRITMLAPTVELLAHSDLHPALSDLLVEAAQDVHGRGSLMQNPGEFPHAIEHDYPMSEDAARYYKSGKSLAYRYLPFWLASLVSRAAVVLVPIIVVLIPGLRFAPYLYGWRIRRRIYKHYGELMALERAMLEPLTPEQRAELLQRLDRIEKSVVSMKTPGAFADQAYILRRHIRFVRDGLEGGPSASTMDEDIIMR
ncbi:TAXI family TRAP transporter solute-binding subunit [Solimonas marina]|uniref:TAXI family TRAP transporter solute-binding subunit n=1 Tax=Solimonas marina TaxID=2714601 RepID=UPI00344FF1D7